MEESVKNYLEREPLFRERANKDRGIANLLIEKYHLEIEKSRLTAVIQDANSMDRYWRLLTRRYTELRGKDWLDGKRLAQQKEIDLGYEMGFNEDIKRLNNLKIR